MSQALTPERFATIVRAHWGIENGLHWVLDVTMNEDQMQQFSFWWTGVRPKGHTGLEKDLAAILGRLGLIQGRDGGARQPAERRAALL
jgi:hypothetical protein